MTRSGDEPRLGGTLGPDTSDAPMLSSVQTRVIASARGAYAARSLLPLLRAMTPEQWHGFRVLLVGEALHHARPILTSAGGQIEHRRSTPPLAGWMSLIPSTPRKPGRCTLGPIR